VGGCPRASASDDCRIVSSGMATYYVRSIFQDLCGSLNFRGGSRVALIWYLRGRIHAIIFSVMA
jgi:hypothetical protein